jgi:C4-dicarboxylate transporter DctQ subunit
MRGSRVFFRQVAGWLDRAEKAILVWTILGLAIVGFVQVITRYVFNFSFSWYEELGRFLGVFITFLGAAVGVKSGTHFAMDLFVLKLNRPWQQLLRTITAALSGSFCLLVVFTSWKIVSRMHGYGTTSSTMNIPMYVAYLPIPVFSLVMGLRFCRMSLAALRELRTPENSAGETQ